MTTSFYESLPLHTDFDEMADGASYVPLPADWIIGVSDIVGSTAQIEAGNYKTVNTVGAAVISALINTFQGSQFPFVFGGDGAAFGLPPEHGPRARQALAAVSRWALDEFNIELRTAIVPLGEIRQAGLEVAVARFEPSDGIDYAMFTGGGVAWAESQMKDGRYLVEMAPQGTLPDLTGLSCRWTPIDPDKGTILCVLIQPNANAAPDKVAKIMHQVLRITDRLERSGHPVAASGPGYAWPPSGLDLEARATHGKSPLWIRKLQLLWETFVALIFFRFQLSVGGFDANHYVETARRNSDFRKFDDGLKMTLNCDVQTVAELKKLLDQAQTENLIIYGMVEQKSALMTCIVPSITQDDHIHFIDGAQGGYAEAAKQIKAAA